MLENFTLIPYYLSIIVEKHFCLEYGDLVFCAATILFVSIRSLIARSQKTVNRHGFSRGSVDLRVNIDGATEQ